VIVQILVLLFLLTFVTRRAFVLARIAVGVTISVLRAVLIAR